GKSTLISSISAAKPKIADYPFTTLEPHLGVVRFDEHEFVVADIPGLIEGASEGRGLGHRFLRHIERARVLVVLVDLTAGDGTDPAEQYRILLQELGRYQPELLTRPRLVVASKADVVEDADVLADALGVEAMVVSAVTGAGLRPLLGAAATLVEQARVERAEAVRYVIHRPEPAGVAGERAPDGGWTVLGRPARRAVALSDLTNAEALAYAQGRLKRLGVDKALTRAGARPGDRVRIGTFEFEYEPD
ncbi:MAG: Obg family GTPase CgtA, partial [Actinomycetes bacterium]